MKTILLTTLILGAIPVYAGAAKAAEVQTRSVTVPVGDLALGQSQGADAALQRIQRAANSVCGPVTLPFELSLTRQRRACVRRATEHAIYDLGAPLVTARYYHTEPTRLMAAG